MTYQRQEIKVNLTEKLVDDLYALSNADLSDAVVLQAKRCLLDYLGVTFAGAELMREKGNKLLHELGDSSDDAAVIGFGKKTNVQTAAFINGLSSHIAELDDGVRFGMIHPGSPVFSALLPIAENEKVTGSVFLRGIVIGYEAEVRLACAIQPSHYNRGYHPTGTCGTIGAAMGIAAMLGFSKHEMKQAMAAAAVSASGTLKVLEDDSEIKPLNVGHAALAGLLAAFIARVGFQGPKDALAGETGFFSMMAQHCDLRQLERNTNDPLAVQKVYVKPYAACRHAHPAIEAALKIRLNNGISSDRIKSIKVTTYRGVLGKHDHTNICGVSSAKMSIPYSVAVALVRGKAGLQEYTEECVNNAEILALVPKVIVCADEQLSALVPHKRAAIVEVATDQGERYTERVDLPKGEPETPLSDDELKDKFLSLADYGNKSLDQGREIIQIVWNVEKELHKLFALL